ncbi:MAG: hypothetical protein K2G19_07820, partial [Lachnospiraceae bacterium]|nr:hypothetical protein [Lachnospiraceae bacterium]
KGVRMARPGDDLGLMEALILRPVWKGCVESIVMQDEGALAVLDRELPNPLPENPVMENLSLCPSVIIRKCEFRKNRARGILLTCKKALVEDCLFETAGAAVYLEGEACSWYESGATDAIILKSNHFLNCSYIPAWGEAPVTVCPKTEGDGQWYFHASIKMINNIFYSFDDRILYARQAGQILAKDNRFYRTKDYPGREGMRFDIANCGIFSEEYSMP